MAVEMKWTTMIMFGKRHIAEQVNKDGGDSSHIISVTLIRYVLYLTLQFELIFSSPVSVFFLFSSSRVRFCKRVRFSREFACLGLSEQVIPALPLS